MSLVMTCIDCTRQFCPYIGTGHFLVSVHWPNLLPPPPHWELSMKTTYCHSFTDLLVSLDGKAKLKQTIIASRDLKITDIFNTIIKNALFSNKMVSNPCSSGQWRRHGGYSPLDLQGINDKKYKQFLLKWRKIAVSSTCTCWRERLKWEWFWKSATRMILVDPISAWMACNYMIKLVRTGSGRNNKQTLDKLFTSLPYATSNNFTLDS
jgi:hypothetical protein